MQQKGGPRAMQTGTLLMLVCLAASASAAASPPTCDAVHLCTLLHQHRCWQLGDAEAVGQLLQQQVTGQAGETHSLGAVPS